MKARKFILICLFVSVFGQGCGQNRVHLTEDEKQWNPYKKGQLLIFESSRQKLDSIEIIDVREKFPDGLGTITYNERLRVLAKHHAPGFNGLIDSYIFSIVAKTDKRPTHYQFDIQVENAITIENEYVLEYLSSLSEIELQVKAGIFNDVIVIANPKDYSSVKNAIDVIYWSKEYGFVRFDKYDGTYWELVKIIDSF